ncbi:MAG: ADP-ribosylglycohydrolase family protein [Limnochordia bacterium]
MEERRGQLLLVPPFYPGSTTARIPIDQGVIHSSHEIPGSAEPISGVLGKGRGGRYQMDPVQWSVGLSRLVLSGIMGLAVGDALGVPVEFRERETLTRDPVVGMRAYGTYNKPSGTWSDDTSMTLCLMSSLAEGLDYDEIMRNFLKWYKAGEFTADGHTFDVGTTTSAALERFGRGVPALECGGTGEYDNGNGSLMRILPLVFYLCTVYGVNFQDSSEAFDIIHNVSALTHAHKRSQIACGIYLSIAAMLLSSSDLEYAVKMGIAKAVEYYEKQPEYAEELDHFSRLRSEDFRKIPREEISSSGYVVSSLEAAIWCLLNTNDYASCVLEAVNLGDDTDTVAAIAGGLAGLAYGYEAIPQDWLNVLLRREYLEDTCHEFSRALVYRGTDKEF